MPEDGAEVEAGRAAAAATSPRCACIAYGRLRAAVRLMLIAPFFIVVFALPPMWIGFTVALAPVISSGMLLSAETVGEPNHWLFRKKLPHSLLLWVFHIPMGACITLYSIVCVPLLLPALHLFRELLCCCHGGERVRALRRALATRKAAQRARVPQPPTDAAPPKLLTRESHRHSHHHWGPCMSCERYSLHESVWAALEGRDGKVEAGDVRLLSLRWLMELAERGGVLPRRQDLPEEAFIDVATLRHIEANASRFSSNESLREGTLELFSGRLLRGFCLIVGANLGVQKQRNPDRLLPIVAISYCWLERDHPDRDGRQLQVLCQRLAALYGGRGLSGACREYGFSDMGVFLDWASLYQKDPALWHPWMTDATLMDMSDEQLLARGAWASPSATESFAALDSARMVIQRQAYESSRTDAQKAAFSRGLMHTMDLWYGHAGTTVVLLTDLPRELPPGFDATRTYESRGWTTFERCSAELAKTYDLLAAKWQLVIDVADAGGGAQRRLPTTPSRMAELLETRQFTNGADKLAVLELYTGLAEKILGGVAMLHYQGLALVRSEAGWTAPGQLAAAMHYCPRLEELVVSGCQIDDDGLAEFAAGLGRYTGKLAEIDLGSNRFGRRGIEALCRAFAGGAAPNLEVLDLGCCLFGCEGAIALADAIAAGQLPAGLRRINLGLNDIGEAGATALAVALLQGDYRCKLMIHGNRLGLAGQSAIFHALEAMHGLSVSHLFAVSSANAPFPAGISRAWARGWRAKREGSTTSSGRPGVSGGADERSTSPSERTNAATHPRRVRELEFVGKVVTSSEDVRVAVAI